MSFALYLLGYVVVVVGAVYMLHLAHVPQTWIVGVAIILVGAGIVTGVQTTKTRDKD